MRTTTQTKESKKMVSASQVTVGMAIENNGASYKVQKIIHRNGYLFLKLTHPHGWGCTLKVKPETSIHGLNT